MESTRSKMYWITNPARLPVLGLFFTAYLGSCLIGIGLPGDGAPLIWPAAGVLLSMMSITHRRRWWRVVLVAIVADLSAHWLLDAGGVNQTVALIAVTRIVEGMFGAWYLGRLVPRPWRRRTSQEITSNVVLCAIVAASVGAILLLLVRWPSIPTLEFALVDFRERWLSDLLGILLVAPMFVGMILRSTVSAAKSRSKRVATWLVPLVALWLGWLLLFSLQRLDGLSVAIRVVIVCVVLLPLVVWRSARMEPLYVAVLMFAAAAATAYGVADTGTPLGAAVQRNSLAAEATLILVMVVYLSAFARSISAFERRHVMKLMAVRQGAGLLVGRIATLLAQPSDKAMDSVLARCLELVGQFAGADRCMIAHFDTEQHLVNESSSWVRPGIPSSKSLSQQLRFEDFGGGIENLLAGRSQFSRRRDHKAGTPVGDYLRQIDTRSAGFVPLRNGEEVIGTLGLAWVRREMTWSNEVLATLRSVGEVIGHTITRLQIESVAERYRLKLRRFMYSRNRLEDTVRREIATDLHDGAAQSLAVARMKIGQYAAALKDSEAAVSEIDSLVKSALEEIREIIEKASPSILYEFGLQTAIVEYASYASVLAGFDIVVCNVNMRTDPEETQAAFLYRVCRELVTNAIKHAEASSIKVTLGEDDQQFNIQVTDNGVGMGSKHFRPDTAGNRGFGLFSIDESASFLGGSINVESDASGTTVIVVLPKGEDNGETNDTDR